MTATVGATPAPAHKPRRAGSLPAGERRAMIIEATLPLLLEHGEMVTTRQIAEAAGIAEGTIFRVFADKDALIAAVVEHAADPTRVEAAFAAIDLSAPLEVAVTEAVRILQRRTLDMARLMASVGPRHHRTGPMPDRPGLIALFEVHRISITVEPAAAARWLAALTMSTSHPMISHELLPPERIAALFLHGVSNEARPC
jgi:AcrR family transcriptional regulator